MATDDWDMEYWSDAQTRQPGDADGASEPALYGVRVRLRGLEPGDELRLYQVYQWASDERERPFWRYEPGAIGFDQFRERLGSTQAEHAPLFIVEGLHSGRMIGWVYADQFAADRLSCRMRVYVIPEARVYGAGAEAGIHFLDHLFGALGMRKVIAEAPLTQERVWKMAQHWGFQIEDVLRDEWRMGGQGHDVVRLAIHRDEWRRRLADALGAPDPTPAGGAAHLRETRQTQATIYPALDAPQYV